MSEIDRSAASQQLSPPNTGDNIVEFAKWLSVADAVAYCAANGIQRNIKTVRRWAHRSVAHPETAEVLAQKQDTETDFRYVIELGSLDVKIAQELAFEAQQTRAVMPAGNRAGAEMTHALERRDMANLLEGAGPDTPAAARTWEGVGGAASSIESSAEAKPLPHEGYDAFLKEQIAKKDRQIGNLYRQLERRDEQIMAMLERDRETNILIKGLQEALLPATSLAPDGVPARRLEVRSEAYRLPVDNDFSHTADDGVY
jgi:hypothetical protein